MPRYHTCVYNTVLLACFAGCSDSQTTEQPASESPMAQSPVTVGFADGLLYQQPMDGAWVRFDMYGSFKRPGNDNAKVTHFGTLTISSVGTTEVSGMPCRWIEISKKAEESREPFTQIDKLLIPEQFLTEGKEPLKHVLKLWRKHSKVANGRPTQIEDLGGRGANFLEEIRVDTPLHGPFETVKKLDKISVDSKIGKLDCGGVIASERVGKPGGFVITSSYTIRLHNKVPFGVVTWDVEVNMERDGQAFSTMGKTLKLADFGTNAESAIPDAK